MTYVKTRSEIIDHYKKCKSALQASCEGYDKGNQWEASRLATAAYAMVSDGGKNSRSILTQLGLRSSLKFISYSYPPNKNNMLPENPLTMVTVTAGVGASVLPVL